MIVLGIALLVVGVFIVLVSTAGFDEAKRDGEGLYGLPIAVLAVGIMVAVLGVLVLSKWN